jgi:S-formylglutathione hydrolase FrmB
VATHALNPEKQYYSYIRFDGRELEGTEEDVFGNAKKIVDEGLPCPRIYHSTGADDFLLGAAHQTRDFFQSIEGNPFGYTYEEDPGAHTWEYWDLHIQRFLEFINK